MGDQKSLCKEDDHEVKFQRMEFNKANYVGWDCSEKLTACAKALIQEKEEKFHNNCE